MYGKEQSEQEKWARELLFQTVRVTDPVSGIVTEKEVESPVYRAYRENQAAYQAARQKYNDAYTAAQSNTVARQNWPLTAPTLQMPVKAAYDRWRSQSADSVETALRLLGVKDP